MIKSHGFPPPPSNQSTIPAYVSARVRDWISAGESKTLWIACKSGDRSDNSNAGTLALSYLLPSLFCTTPLLLAYKCQYDNELRNETKKMMISLLQQARQQLNINTFPDPPLSVDGRNIDTFERSLLAFEVLLQSDVTCQDSNILVILDGLNCIDRNNDNSLSELMQMLHQLQKKKPLKLLIATNGTTRSLEDSIESSNRVHIYSDSVSDYPLRSFDRVIPKPISKELAATIELSPITESKGNGELFDEKSAEEMPGAAHKAKNWLSSYEELLGHLKKASPDWESYAPSAQRVKVCILDTGLDEDTPHFSSYTEDRLSYRSFLEEDAQNPEKMADTFGHGTHVTSLLRKICPYAMFYVARISKNNSWTPENHRIVANAIEWAASHSVQIITMSFGFPNQIDCIADAIESHSRNIIFFAAASNGGTNVEVAFPASADDVICVTSSDGLGNWSYFNPHGDGVKIGYSTLGEAITSEYPEALEPSGSKTQSGTSFATPIAAGIAGLLLDFCGYYFGKLEFDDAESLMKRLRKKRGMMKALNLITKDSRSGTTRYIYPQMKFQSLLGSSGSNGQEAAFKVCKAFALEIASVLRDM